MYVIYKDHIVLGFSLFLPRALCEVEGPWPTYSNKGDEVGTPKYLSYDWSTQFMKVILLGLSLIRSE